VRASNPVYAAYKPLSMPVLMQVGGRSSVSMG
jgi:hypothetical protein